MELDASILDRLQLRRAAIGQLSGVDTHALDKLVDERMAKILERRDKRIAWLNERFDELNKDARAS